MRQKVIPAVPERVVYEKLATLSISYLDESATAGLVEGELIDGQFVPDLKSVRYIDLGNKGYKELMKSKPDKNKPKGEFRTEDVLDLIYDKDKK